MTMSGTINDVPEGERGEISELKEQFDALAWKLVRMEPAWYGHFGMTRLQAFTLQVIDRFGPEVDMATLATLTSLPPSSITSIIDRFVEHGHVTRERDERDRRRVTATITASGRETVAALDARSAGILAEMLDGIAERDIETVNRVFRHMIDRLDHLNLESVDPPETSGRT